jgi:hypothetical protein
MVTKTRRLAVRSRTKKVGAKKISTKNKSSVKKSSSTGYSDEKLIKNLIARDDILVDNFVGLQKAMVNVSVKFGELTDRIDKLLDIYQKAADVFVEKQIKEADKRIDLDKKVNTVMEQNRVLSRRRTPVPQRRLAPQMPRPPMAPAPTNPVSPPMTPTSTPNVETAPRSNQETIPPAPAPQDQTKPRPLPTI